MKVYALVGKSGTGKSYQAMNLCREKNIKSVIDDGLFIVGNDIVAGTSAKRQTTKTGAIKTALFLDEEHKNSVKKKIDEISPDNILVLGTSDGMVKRIAERLELPKIEDIIYIETITTENEREAARQQRHELGKHVIPVPTFQLKREFSGYFLHPLRIFRDKGRAGKSGFAEKSVVRPTYSYMGEYIISDKVISDIVACITAERRANVKMTKVFTEKTQTGIKVTVTVFIRYGTKIFDVARNFQEQVATQVGYMTAFNVDCVNIEVRDLR